MIEMKSIEDIYSWFVEYQDYLRPTEAEVYHQHRNAEQWRCGYIMEKGKPGTFRAHPMAAYGTIIIFDAGSLDQVREEIMKNRIQLFDGLWDDTTRS